ncbi:hypothetical protein MBLNU230_g6781t1 [Neophaeotheca triangularis]
MASPPPPPAPRETANDSANRSISTANASGDRAPIPGSSRDDVSSTNATTSSAAFPDQEEDEVAVPPASAASQAITVSDEMDEMDDSYPPFATGSSSSSSPDDSFGGDAGGVEDDVNAGEPGMQESTLYFDAEEGTLWDEDGDRVVFGGESEGESGEGEGEEDEGDGEEGVRTPVAAAGSAGAVQEQAAPAAAAAEARRVTSRFHPGVFSLLRFWALGRRGGFGLGCIMRYLNQAGVRGIFSPAGGTMGRAGYADDDDEDDEDYYPGYGAARRRRRQRPVQGDRYPPIPSEEGRKLMESGTFGANDRCDHSACGVPYGEATQRRRRHLSRRLLDREIGLGSRGRQRALNGLLSQDLIPSSKADMIVNMNARCYSGQFSEDGSFFFACGQDFKVRMYDTSNPYDWSYYKTVNYYGGQWTITDASLSPDNRHLAYSSIRSQVCLAPTDPANTSEPQLLDFSDMGRGAQNQGGGGFWGRRSGHFGIWSLRFSGDGNEIVAGTSDQSVYVYDLETRRSILRIPGHQDDVNAVCFGDKMSPHILYSGSDDTTLKIWDRRSLSDLRPAGMFLGHTEGLTYIDSKGDGRYVISNAKDQTCKLWDLRKMISTDQGERINPQDYTTNFDYRFAPYDTDDHQPHPHDCSLVTFRGHRVLKTLIRCHFSPPGSTDSRYIYSGSHDGKVYIWNLDGTLKSTIDVLEATRDSRPRADERLLGRYGGGGWKTLVRDCSWHPSAPVMAATSWNGFDHGLGTLTVHSWNDGADADEVGDHAVLEAEGRSDRGLNGARSLGSTPMGARVTPQLQFDQRYYGVRPADEVGAVGAGMGLGAMLGVEETDEEEEVESEEVEFVDEDEETEEEDEDDGLLGVV